MRSVFTTILLSVYGIILPFSCFGQQLKSPSEFLGYPLGSAFTYHHKVVDYLRYAERESNNIVLHKYGQTYERRELYVAYISTPQNLENLEEIKKNNLVRTGLNEGAPAENDIGIVWLSYNVHGNEANSTETSMKVLYELVNGKNPEYTKWLDKLVIVLDPCLNPDGRDRYVNWYNQVANSKPNANIYSREHHEGWAGGRSNHYLFDLNRDWIWQTQIESVQRLKLYNEIMPHVHVDFHEQFYNSQYYFAPAAYPYHEAISNWQKTFQEKMGENNARYFDEKGWLYFTKESFDLLYPGYGDTYPMYNGAIGMTYEMPGHSTSGLAIKTMKGDTLTLGNRIEMHFTTSIATLETCYNNRTQLINEFTEFFQNSNKRGMYILRSDRQDKIDLLRDLLDKNKIIYKSPTREKSLKTLSFSNNTTLTIKIDPGDLIIPVNQPKSTLVKVMFERNTKLADSLTYDITAWSLPFVYGLDGYYSEESFDLVDFNPKFQVQEKSEINPYAYILNWNSMKDARFLSEILDRGYKVNYSTKSFKLDGANYNAGSLIITRIDNESKANFGNELLVLAKEYDRPIVPVYSGTAIDPFELGSQKIKYLKKPKIFMLAGEGVYTTNFGELWYFLEQEINYPIDIVNKQTLDRVDINDYDILLLASGRYNRLQSEEGFKKIDHWVKGGGKLILIENAIAGFIGEKKFQLEKITDDENSDEKEAILFPFENNERENLKKYIQGGIIKLNIDNTHPLAYGYEKHYYTLKKHNKVYKFLNDGWNVGYITTANQAVAGYIGSDSKDKLNKNLVIGSEQRGRGKVIYFVDNTVFRGFWQNGKLFLANALFFDN